jgi:hypothetical protein
MSNVTWFSSYRLSPLFGLAVMAMTAAGDAHAQLADLDKTFGSTYVGRYVAAFDVPSSARTDEAIAVLPLGSNQYTLVGRGTSNVAGKYRIGIAVVNANGSQASKVVDTEDVLDVRAACLDPSGRVMVAATVEDSASTTGIQLNRFLANGARDATFTPLLISGDVGSPPYLQATQLTCIDNTSVAVLATARTSVQVPSMFISYRVVLSPAPVVTSIYHYNPGGDGYWDARSAVRTSGGRWLTLAAHDSNDTPLQFKAMTGLDGSYPDLPTVTDVPVSVCAVAATTRIDPPRIIAAASNRFHAAGTLSDNGTDRLYVLSGMVDAAGTVSAVSCSTEPARSQPLLVWYYEFGDLALDSFGDLYLFGTYHPDNFGASYQELRRYRATGGTYVRDNGFGIGGQMTWSFGRNVSNSGPYTDIGNALLFDARNGYRLLAAGAAEWTGVDRDASLTALSTAPMFASGFE